MVEIEELVKEAQKGCNDAFVELIKNSEGTMYRVAKSFLKLDIDCADAIQETILKSFHSLSTLREPKFFKTWLIRILINECKNMLNTINKTIPTNKLMMQNQSHDEYQKVEIDEALDSLEEDLRALSIMYYIEDITVKEISNLLELSEGTVKSRLFRARKKLAQWFGIAENRRESSR